MAVVYAVNDGTAPLEIAWPAWVADRPAPGARMERGAPVCTVLARADTATAVRALADERVDMVLSWLAPVTAQRGVAADAVANG
jgi:predicted ATP-grasp superfamily ATP-dependent carboligase